jgi:hypothetical protein
MVRIRTSEDPILAFQRDPPDVGMAKPHVATPYLHHLACQ